MHPKIKKALRRLEAEAEHLSVLCPKCQRPHTFNLNCLLEFTDGFGVLAPQNPDDVATPQMRREVFNHWRYRCIVQGEGLPVAVLCAACGGAPS